MSITNTPAKDIYSGLKFNSIVSRLFYKNEKVYKKFAEKNRDKLTHKYGTPQNV